MATAPADASTNSSYVCELCEKSFQFKSKYMRHLKSVGHKRQSAFSITSDEEEFDINHVSQPILNDPGVNYFDESSPNDTDDVFLYSDDKSLPQNSLMVSRILCAIILSTDSFSPA